jgi:hypothetical protein
MEYKMIIRKIIAALLLTVSLSAAADFVTTEEGYEVALSNMTVPVTSTGSLVFTECAECDSRMIRMTRNTRFIVNGQTVELQEFRKRVFHVRDRTKVAVTIMHHLESNTVTYVAVNL